MARSDEIEFTYHSSRRDEKTIKTQYIKEKIQLKTAKRLTIHFLELVCDLILRVLSLNLLIVLAWEAIDISELIRLLFASSVIFGVLDLGADDFVLVAAFDLADTLDALDLAAFGAWFDAF